MIKIGRCPIPYTAMVSNFWPPMHSRTATKFGTDHRNVVNVLQSRVCTVVHYAVLEAQNMEYGKFDPSVNRKRLKILIIRLGHIITLRSRVVVQNLTKKSVNPFWLGK